MDFNSIKSYVAQQTEFMQDWLLSYDYSRVRLYNTTKNKLVQNPEMFRRGNDWIAAAYMHSVALDQGSGDDCVDTKGNYHELKLAFMDASQIHFGTSGTALLYGASDTSLNQAYNAKYRVYATTQNEHHKQETAYVLMSKQHNCYITGFMMTGEQVQKTLMESGKTTVERSISLGNFITNGYEFKSGIPHIGWGRYYNALFNYVKAREQRITGDEAREAIKTWVELGNPNNLTKL
jgi:hypothetical protein